ncbi:hypothetical protein N7488_004645 [Penicillium malachiteum]|nr:hypothetical protein N7488_004645 [Penicillium malachiteum]
MDKTYLPVLMRLLGRQDEEDKDLILQYFKQIVDSIILFADSLPVNALARFLGLQERLISNLLDSFRSVLRLPSGQNQPVQILHQSFRDFLLQTGSEFYIDKAETHKTIVFRCLRTMRAKLKKDTCNLKNYGTKRMNIDDRLITHYLQPELQYSSRYWVHHLEQCAVPSDMAQETLLFLQQHFLHWVETMGTLGLASEVVLMINSLQMMTRVSDIQTPRLRSALTNNKEVSGSTISDFLHDAKLFVLKFQQIANDVPLQLYCAGLIFAPISSIICRQFINELPSWIYQLPQVSNQWRAELQTLEGHSSPVHAVAFSPDSRFLASCSGSWEKEIEDNVIQLWDAATGALRQTLLGHSKAVTSLAFSPKGLLLASGSNDNSVRLWNPITGALNHTIENHPMGVHALAFSPSGRLLASGSVSSQKEEDSTLRLWDTATGTLKKELEGNTGGVNSLVFSPDGRLLASGSGDDFDGNEEDYVVRIWNTSTGTLQQTLEGHSGQVSCVVFSSDGHLIASGSTDSNVRIWDSATGALKQTLKAHDIFGVTALAFSPNCRLLASSSSSLVTSDEDDNVVRLWDPATGALLQILRGHSAGVSSLAFSHDGRQLASGSNDRTVRLWDPIKDQLQPTLQGHKEWVSDLVLSPDGNMLASGSNDRTIRLWSSITGVLNHVLEGHSEAIYDITFSPDSRLLASGSFDHTVRLWDSATGELRHVLVGHRHLVIVAFSADGFLLFSTCFENAIRIWDPITGILKQALESPSYNLHPIAFSPDMNLLASASDGVGPNLRKHGVLLWGLATGEVRRTLIGHSAQVSSVAFSPDGHLLASSCFFDVVRLWDPASGLLLQTFEARASALAFSPDSQILAFSFPPGPCSFGT